MRSIDSRLRALELLEERSRPRVCTMTDAELADVAGETSAEDAAYLDCLTNAELEVLAHGHYGPCRACGWAGVPRGSIREVL